MKNFKRRDKNAKEPSMKIYVRNNDINGAIRILKKKLMKEGLFQELRERTHHTTRGEKRRRAKAKAVLVDSKGRWKKEGRS